MKKVKPEIPFSETPSASVALKAQVASIVKAFSGDYGRIVAEIIADGQAYSEALKSFRDRFFLPRREAARTIIERGIETGEFDKKLDPELAMDILYSPIYYRLLIGHLPLDDNFAVNLSERVLHCFQGRSKK